MPKLTENVLIGGQVRLAGEDISEADARGIRPEVFERPGGAPVDEQTPVDEQPGDEDAADTPAESDERPAEEKKEPEAPKSGRRGSSSRK